MVDEYLSWGSDTLGMIEAGVAVWECESGLGADETFGPTAIWGCATLGSAGSERE